MADRASRWTAVIRVIAAATVVGAGVVHLQQYYGVYYRVIPTIGPLFILDFVAAAVIGIALLLPLDRLWRPLTSLAATGGIALSVGAIIGLEISESGTLFGFHEHGYRTAVVLALALEAASVLLLVAYLAARSRVRRQERRADLPMSPARRQVSAPM
jgi:hypothetical protein